MTRLHDFPHFFQDALRRELLRARRLGSHLSCLIIKIDNFPQINRQYGYVRSDAMLRKVAGLLKRTCRNVDFFAWNPDGEFSVIMPMTNRSGAESLARRIMDTLKAENLLNVGDFELTSYPEISILAGISRFPDPRVKDEETLFSLAGEALNMASERSLNCLIVA